MWDWNNKHISNQHSRFAIYSHALSANGDDDAWRCYHFHIVVLTSFFCIELSFSTKWQLWLSTISFGSSIILDLIFNDIPFYKYVWTILFMFSSSSSTHRARERPGRVNFITLVHTQTLAHTHTIRMKLKLKCAQTRKTLLTRSYAIRWQKYQENEAKLTANYTDN